jgi:glycosyltransferase involved in cell wall biosynthesis
MLDKSVKTAKDTGQHEKKILSVVIGIRDWEIFRLKLAIKSHYESTLGDKLEVVISDYGSQNHLEVEALAKEMECKYIYIPAPLWSRSGSLNAGLNLAEGDYLITTDADIIFSPKIHEITVDLLKRYPNSLQLAQCYDLPQSLEITPDIPFDWELFAKVAKTRPRWGMGGLAGFTREAVERIRGYEERMVVWGAEDNDFAKRMRHSGGFMNWIDDHEARIYHVWHPPFLQTNPDAQSIFLRNKDILLNDHSVIRNLGSDAIYESRSPMVSVVIATYNRAEYITESINSVLDQTFGDFELIIVDDCSDDNTPEVVQQFTDERIRYFRLDEQSGVARARNFATTQAKGKYIAVHDDDDLMVEHRLELQLKSIDKDTHGVYGGWIDFDQSELTLTKQNGRSILDVASLAFIGGILLHPTLMIRREMFEKFQYHEHFRAGSDYNLMFRMVWNGVKLVHCGDFVTMRRIHGENMTNRNAGVQKASSLVTTSVFLNSISSEYEKFMRAKAKESELVEIDISGREETFYKLLPQKLVSILYIVPYSKEAHDLFVDSENICLTIAPEKNDDKIMFSEICVGGKDIEKLLNSHNLPYEKCYEVAQKSTLYNLQDEKTDDPIHLILQRLINNNEGHHLIVKLDNFDLGKLEIVENYFNSTNQCAFAKIGDFSYLFISCSSKSQIIVMGQILKLCLFEAEYFISQPLS